MVAIRRDGAHPNGRPTPFFVLWKTKAFGSLCCLSLPQESKAGGGRACEDGATCQRLRG
jgi:hypothetical protein